MIEWASGACLLSGALVSLLAAIGVLRLPDVFMRMHAATKAGVVGCGLILIGVALADGSWTTGLKAVVATAFLLLTTPVAGHLLGRAAYISGVPFWRGTIDDQLESELQRRHFGPGRLPRSASTTSITEPLTANGLKRVVLALAQGPLMDAAIRQAIAVAGQHHAELCGVAIIDEPRLFNVGPIPIGGGHHATELRKWRITQARQAAADVIQIFEAQARAADLKYSVRLEEGRPHAVLRPLLTSGTVVAVAPQGWFDQGVLQPGVNVVHRLVSKGIYPLLVFGTALEEVRRIRFIDDGSQRSWNTWRWLLDAGLWPEATFVIDTESANDGHRFEQALEEARRRARHVARTGSSDVSQEYVVIGNADSRGWLPRWLERRRLPADDRILAVG